MNIQTTIQLTEYMYQLIINNILIIKLQLIQLTEPFATDCDMHGESRSHEHKSRSRTPRIRKLSSNNRSRIMTFILSRSKALQSAQINQHIHFHRVSTLHRQSPNIFFRLTSPGRSPLPSHTTPPTPLLRLHLTRHSTNLSLNASARSTAFSSASVSWKLESLSECIWVSSPDVSSLNLVTSFSVCSSRRSS